MYRKITRTIKITLILFLGYLNFYVWKEIIGDTFYEAILTMVSFILGLYLYGEIFHGKRRWR